MGTSILDIKLIISYIFLYITIWKLVWYLVYLLTGFYISTITINNGLSFNGITIASKKMDLQVKSLRFRLWGNTRRLIIHEFRLKLKSSHKTRNHCKNTSKNEAPVDFDKNSGEEDLTLAIFPENRLIASIMRFILSWLPRVDIEIRNSGIQRVITGASEEPNNLNVQVLSVDYLRINQNSNKSQISPRHLKFHNVVVANNLNALAKNSKNLNDKLSQALGADDAQIFQSIDENAPLSIDSFKLETNWVINLDNGTVNGIKIKVNIDRIQVSMFDIIKTILSQKSNNESSKTSGNSISNVSYNKFRRFHSQLNSALEEISFNLANTKLSSIPIANPSENDTMDSFLSYDKPLASLEVSAKNISANSRRLNDKSPGYQVLFDPLDNNASHITITTQLIAINYITTGGSKDKSVRKAIEILSMPSTGFTLKTNFFDYFADGKNLKNCASELFITSSSPILELDAQKFATLFYSINAVKKYLKVKKGSSKNISESKLPSKVNDVDSESEETIAEENFDKTSISDKDISFKKKFIALIDKYYPQIEVKLTIEQPRAIVKYLNETTNCTEMLNFSYSYLDLHILSNSNFEYDCNCNILKPVITYIEKSSSITGNEIPVEIKENIVLLDSIKFKVDILKQFNIVPRLAFATVSVNLSSLKVLKGISSLLQQLNAAVGESLAYGTLNVELNNFIEERIRANPDIFRPTVQVPIRQKLFKKLPFWLCTTTLSVHKIDIMLASRSIFITPENLHHKSNSSTRKVRIMLDSIDLTLNNDASTKESVYTYWSSKINLKDFNVEANNTPFLSVPQVDCAISASESDSKEEEDQNKSLLVEGNVAEIKAKYDKFRLFTLLGSLYIMKEIIVKPLNTIKNKWKKDKKNIEREVENTEDSLKDYISVVFGVELFELQALLNDGFNINFQIFDAKVGFKHDKTILSHKFARLLGDSPTIPNMWARLFCIDSTTIVIDKNQENLVDVVSEGIRAIQPHQFVVYHLFDNLAIAIKTGKHLVQTLLDKTNRSMRVSPKTMHPPKIPQTRVRSRLIAFSMEDDPFESELGMIYQLGLVEQKKRIELETIFESQMQSEDNIDQKIYELQEYMSQSWIRKVRTYKTVIKNEMIKNKKFLFGNETFIDEKLNEDISAYLTEPPLLNIFLEGVDVSVSKSTLNIPDFIYDMGQQVPKDRSYSLLVPLYLDLKLKELRIHLKDYPLPLLYVPENLNGETSLSMKGNLILTEDLVTSKENLRNVEVPLIADAPSYHMVIEKSLAIVKMYTDIGFHFNGRNASRFVWGHSYQFALQQTILNFDQFSKAPVDPSTKLGIWDKMRLIIHGQLKISVSDESALHVAFKGSRDPYKINGEASGFVLGFKEDILWKINEHDDSKDLFKVEAKKVSWFVPNYLAEPLVSWIRPSSKSTFLQKTDHFIDSLFGYYLIDVPPAPKEILSDPHRINEKTVLKLNGGIKFLVGFLLQRKKAEDEYTYESKPHYNLQLYNPKYCEENHDSYKGFRSDYIHMFISLTSDNENCHNSIHLSPRVFQHIFKWWKLFAGNMSISIRRGPLFGESNQSQKFSQHLFTNKFFFNFRRFTLSHIHRSKKNLSNKNDDENLMIHGEDAITDDNELIECIGLKAYVDKFVLDLHQRKEPTVQIHERIDRKNKIAKMTFNVGESHLYTIDLRTIYATFNKNENSDAVEKSKWYDPDDFQDVFAPSILNFKRSFSKNHFLFTESFSYYRNNHNSVDDFFKGLGDEKIHDCQLGQVNIYDSVWNMYNARIKQLKACVKDENELAKRINILKDAFEKLDSTTNLNAFDGFQNKFLLICPLMKWNVNNKEIVTKYISLITFRARMNKYLSHESIKLVEDLIKKSSDVASDSDTISVKEKKSMEKATIYDHSDNDTSKNRFDKFEDILMKAKTKSQSILQDYLVKIVSPQIQFQSDEAPQSTMLVATPSIDIKIVTVKENEDVAYSDDVNLEKRYGFRIRDANVFLFDKKDISKYKESLSNSELTYGSKDEWPPWVGLEICEDSSLIDSRSILMQKTNFMVTFEQLSMSGRSNDEEFDTSNAHVSNILRVDVPQIVLTCTSEQYMTLYIIIFSILLVQPLKEGLADKLEMLQLSINLQDMNSLKERLVSLQQYYKLILHLEDCYQFKQSFLSNEEWNMYSDLLSLRQTTADEIFLLMHSILSGEVQHSNNKSKAVADWTIKADEIIIHMIDDERTPIVDLALAKGICKRTINEDGSNINKIDLMVMQAFNLLERAEYPILFEPIEDNSESKRTEGNMFIIEWKMNRPVGGVKFIENFVSKVKPLKVNIDDYTGKKIMEYIFGSDDSNTENPFSKDENDNKIEEVDSNDDVDDSDDDDDDGDDDDGSSGSSPRDSKTKSSTSQFEDSDAKEMLVRSKKYTSIGNLIIESILLRISIKCHSGYLKVLNVEDLEIKLPDFIIDHTIVSALDFTMMFKKFAIKTLLNHSGSLLKNKLSVRKKKGKKIIKRPLKPLKKYASHMKPSELHSETSSILET